MSTRTQPTVSQTPAASTARRSRLGQTLRTLATTARLRLFGPTRAEQYQAQAQVVAGWVVQNVRWVLARPVAEALREALERFQSILERDLYQTLVANGGCCPITNARFLASTPLFERALRKAGLEPTETLVRALPHVRIRIVPGWVKVYGIHTPMDAPLTLYRAPRVSA